MEVDSSAAIPVQAILKLIVDRSGSQEVEDVLKKQDEAFSKVEQTVKRVGSGVEGIGKTVAELVGIGGVGALVDKFFKIETSASNIALAMGKVTGGSSSYGGIRQELLGVQSRTGVSYGEQESALRQLAQSVGLSPKPGQAGMLAEVVAGYSRVTGISSGTLASILGPMLQAEGRASSPGAAAYTIGEARANLSAFPGSQIEGILPVVSSLSTTAALGSPQGAGKGVSVGGIASLLNTISGPGSVLRQPGVAEAAAQGIGGTLQGAYAEPRMQAFLNEAKVGFKEQQLGFNNPAVMEKIVREARIKNPGDSTAAWTKRRILYLGIGGGEAGADALERIEEAVTHGGIHVTTPKMKQEASERAHAQGLTTPEAFLSKLQGKVLGDAFSSPLAGAAAGVAGFLGIRALGAGSLEAGATTLLGGGALAYGGAQALSLLGKESESGAWGIPGSAKLLGAPALGFRELLKNPVSALAKSLHGWEGILGIGGGGGKSPTLIEHLGGVFNPSSPMGLAKAAMQTAEKTYGPGWWHDDAGGEKANQTIRGLLEGKLPFIGPGGPKLTESATGKRGEEALGMVNKAIKEQREYGSLGPQGYWTNKFGEAVEKFAKATEKSGKASAAYQGGGGMHNTSFMGASAVEAMQASVPGMVMAAFLSRGGSTTPMMASTQTAAYAGGSSSAWNAVLEKYSGNSYGLSHVEQLAGEHPGGGAHPGDRKTVEADAKKYGIPFKILWGIYGAESSFGKAASSFGLTGQYPGTGTSGNFGTDARVSAEDLRNLLKSITVNVAVNGTKVQKHQAKIGGAQWA
jgi:hypothetical protein